MSRHEGRTAVITGAALGLGREDAGHLASEGRRAHLLTFVGPPGFFLGDYMGLTSTGRDLLAVVAQPATTTRQACSPPRARLSADLEEAWRVDYAMRGPRGLSCPSRAHQDPAILAAVMSNTGRPRQAGDARLRPTMACLPSQTRRNQT